MQNIKFRKPVFTASGLFDGFRLFEKEGEYDLSSNVKDMQGRYIHEGDILEDPDSERATAKYMDGAFYGEYVDGYTILLSDGEWWIVSHIHATPELLNV